MDTKGIKQLLKLLKYEIIDANNSANWQRVQKLKEYKRKLKDKLNAFRRIQQNCGSNEQGVLDS